MTFQKIVASIAGVLLIIALVFIALAITGVKDKKKFPPVLGECPDYWKDQSIKADGSKCANVKNLGKCDVPPDFSKGKYVGNNGLCEKAKWAKSCDLTWDGITNDTNICQS
jgi:hypothetical protein